MMIANIITCMLFKGTYSSFTVFIYCYNAACYSFNKQNDDDDNDLNYSTE